jgi:hypothetical protein
MFLYLRTSKPRAGSFFEALEFTKQAASQVTQQGGVKCEAFKHRFGDFNQVGVLAWFPSLAELEAWHQKMDSHPELRAAAKSNAASLFIEDSTHETILEVV